MLAFMSVMPLKSPSGQRRQKPKLIRRILLLVCIACGIPLFAAAHPLDEMAVLWDRGSFDSPGESLQWHFEKHGREVGATDVASYARKAQNFYLTVWKDPWGTGAPVPGETPDVRRFTRGPRYVDLYRTSSNQRLIISFGAR